MRNGEDLISAGQLGSIVSQLSQKGVPRDMTRHRAQYLLQNSLWHGQVAAYLNGGITGLQRATCGDLEPFQIQVPPLEVQLPIFLEIARDAIRSGMAVHESSRDEVWDLVGSARATGDDRLLLCSDFGHPPNTARTLIDYLWERQGGYSVVHQDHDIWDGVLESRLYDGAGVDNFVTGDRDCWHHDGRPTTQPYLFRVADFVPLGGKLFENITACQRAFGNQLGMDNVGMCEPLWLLAYNTQGLFTTPETILPLAEWRFGYDDTGKGMVPGLRRVRGKENELEFWFILPDAMARFIGFGGTKIWPPKLKED